MKKSDELFKRTSCLNSAKDNEYLFVLLARDVAAPATIRFWVEERIKQGKNFRTDPQIIEALRCAATMDLHRLPKDL